MFQVQKKACPTCIYRKDSPLDVKVLEAQAADEHGGFTGRRVCHHSEGVCCRGFWNRHKDGFALGQIAQRPQPAVAGPGKALVCLTGAAAGACCDATQGSAGRQQRRRVR
jgi:hypothetical protein